MSVRQSLLAILDQGPCYGYQLRAEFERRTGSTWPLNVGQIYTTLDRLERDGLVAKGETDDQGHVFYDITDAGPPWPPLARIPDRARPGHRGRARDQAGAGRHFAGCGCDGGDPDGAEGVAGTLQQLNRAKYAGRIQRPKNSRGCSSSTR